MNIGNTDVKSHYWSAQISLIFLLSKVLILPKLIPPTHNNSSFHNSPNFPFTHPLANSALVTAIPLLFLKYTPVLFFITCSFYLECFFQNMSMIRNHLFTEIFIFFIFATSSYTSNLSHHFLTYYYHSTVEYMTYHILNYIFILFSSICWP